MGTVRSFVLKEIIACAVCLGSTVGSEIHKWLLVGQNSKAENGVQVVQCHSSFSISRKILVQPCFQ